MSKKFHIIANRDKCTVKDIKRVRSLIKAHADATETAVVFDIDKNTSVPLTATDADYVVVMGGDGTLLSVCRAMRTNQRPIIGINFGKLGYLAQFTMDAFEQLFPDLVDAYPGSAAIRSRSSGRIGMDAITISKRTILNVEIIDTVTGERRGGGLAVNDCVLDIGPPFRTSEIRVEIDSEPLSTIRGDGIIIATPTGSTAYNMSASGPIVHPEVAAICITPKNPHRLSFRPIVAMNYQRIDIHPIQTEGMFVIIDGQEYFTLSQNCVVTIQRYGSELLLVKNPDIGYWATLREKLGWGM